MTPRAVRAHAFAVAHFESCEAHRSHAVAVYEALEALAGRSLLNLEADAIIGDVLGRVGTVNVDEEGDSLERLELQLALEEELVRPDPVKRTLENWTAERALTALLGPLRPLSHWDAETLWLRSVRGVINERVRHREGCTCAVLASAVQR